MKSRKITAIILLSINLLSCSQDKTVELPLTMQNGYGPFRMALGGISPYTENTDNPWYKTYLKVSKLPEGLTDIQIGDIESNINQSVYQNYLLGNITEDRYAELQKSWNWTPDTLSLSKIPIKTKIAFAYGKDSEGIVKIAIDANNNLDLSDDGLFIPLDMASVDSDANRDSIAQAQAVNVSFETFVHNKTVPVSVPLFVMFYNQMNRFMYNFAQYATTQYKGKQIAVSSGSTNLSYANIDIAFLDSLKSGDKVAVEDIYRKNEYVEIQNEIFKIMGVNTNKSTLVLEKTDLPKTQLFSTQIGYKSYPFQGEEFTTKSPVSSDILRGKYVLLDFWATWCGPCIQEFPHLKELYSKTDRAKFEIVGIVGDSPLNTLTDAVERYGLTWSQIVSDDANNITKTYGINGYPTTLLIDTAGIIITKNLRGKELEEKILSLVNE
ncbi:MAG: TlpA family protein disulfide reductase [Tannerella sp.]|jgi:thiol-disulfide isomerase/thioredoxin|nr:TlpA family protein disulfide reductase [Tannerella sp.]